MRIGLPLSGLEVEEHVYGFVWGSRAHGGFGGLGPFAFFGEMHGVADFGGADVVSPGESVGEDFEVGVEVAAAAVGAEVIGKGPVVVGDGGEGGEDGFSFFVTAGAFDEEDEAAHFVLDDFGLGDFKGLAGVAGDGGVAGPFADEEVQLLHGVALGGEIRLLRTLGQSGGGEDEG